MLRHDYTLDILMYIKSIMFPGASSYHFTKYNIMKASWSIFRWIKQAIVKYKEDFIA